MGAISGYRTYIIAALQVIFGFLATVDWNPVLNDPKAGVSVVVGGLLMAIMRKITQISLDKQGN
jgi:hypothetical protein